MDRRGVRGRDHSLTYRKRELILTKRRPLFSNSLRLDNLVRALPLCQPRCVHIPRLHLRILVWRGPGDCSEHQSDQLSHISQSLSWRRMTTGCLSCAVVAFYLAEQRTLNLESWNIRSFRRSIVGACRCIIRPNRPFSSLLTSSQPVVPNAMNSPISHRIRLRVRSLFRCHSDVRGSQSE